MSLSLLLFQTYSVFQELYFDVIVKILQAFFPSPNVDWQSSDTRVVDCLLKSNVADAWRNF